MCSLHFEAGAFYSGKPRRESSGGEVNRLRKLLDTAILSVFPEVYDSVLPTHAKAAKRKEPMDRTDIMPKKETQVDIANAGNSAASSASCVATNVEQSPVQAIVPEEGVRKAGDDARESRVEQLEKENGKLRLELAQARVKIRQLEKKVLSVTAIKGVDELTKFYTGFPAIQCF